MVDSHLRRDLLRFATAGSVDDGKSTLVGRLLYDTKSVLADQIEAVQRASVDKGLTTPDLSLLVDGLRAEREQGITIDVAYRYFSTPKREFVLADTPRHPAPPPPARPPPRGPCCWSTAAPGWSSSPAATPRCSPCCASPGSC